jgi:hypothetical protein
VAESNTIPENINKSEIGECHLMGCGAVWVFITRRFGGTCRLHLQGGRNNRLTLFPRSESSCECGKLTFRFHKMLEGSRVAAQPVGSRVALISIELV